MAQQQTSRLRFDKMKEAAMLVSSVPLSEVRLAVGWDEVARRLSVGLDLELACHRLFRLRAEPDIENPASFARRFDIE
jgi:hypothetical protein